MDEPLAMLSNRVYLMGLNADGVIRLNLNYEYIIIQLVHLSHLSTHTNNNSKLTDSFNGVNLYLPQKC